MGMNLEEACKYVFEGWGMRVDSYEIVGNVIKLKCKSSSGRDIYDGEVVIKNNGENFTYSDAYGSNTPYLFGKNVCQMMTDGKITY